MDEKKLARLRQSLYALGGAAAGVAGVYGWVDGTQAAAWLLVYAALLGVAFFNVDVPDSDGE